MRMRLPTCTSIALGAFVLGLAMARIAHTRDLAHAVRPPTCRSVKDWPGLPTTQTVQGSVCDRGGSYHGRQKECPAEAGLSSDEKSTCIHPRMRAHTTPYASS